MSKSNNATKGRFYIAYGSNLNLGQMAKRCQTAEVIKVTYLQNYRLMFRGKGTAVATIERHQGSKVPIIIWRLQPSDEYNLDIYEGYPHLYRKEMIKVTVDSRRLQAMVYIMNEALHPYGTPSRSYFDTICQGYGYSGFDGRILRHAVLDSVWEAYLAEKYSRGGEYNDGKN